MTIETKNTHLYFDSVNTKKYLRRDTLIAMVVTLIIWFIYLTSSIGTVDIVYAPLIVFIGFALSLFFANQNKPFLQVTFLFLPISAYILYFSIFYPSIKFEFLFLPSLAIFAFTYIRNKRIALAIFCFCLIMSVVAFLYEANFQSKDINKDLNTVNYTHLITTTFVLFLSIFNLRYIYEKTILRRTSISQKLEHSQKIYSNLFQHSFDGIVEINATRKSINSHNASFQKLFSPPSARRQQDFLSEDQITAFFGKLEHISAEARKSNAAQRMPIIYEVGNGNLIETETTIIPINDELDQYLAIISDKTAEYKTKRNLENYGDIFQNSPVGLLNIEERKFSAVNPYFSAFTGSDVDEIIGLSFDAYIHPADREKVSKAFGKVIDQESLNEVVSARFILDDGLIKSGLIRYHGRRDSLDNHIGVIGSVSDISALKRTEAELNKSKTRYKQLIETLPSGVVVIDETGNLLFVSSKTKELLSAKQNFTDRVYNIREFIRASHLPDFDKYLLAIRNNEEPGNLIIGIEYNGSNVNATWEGRGALAYNNQQKRAEYLFAFNDVTERIETTRKLKDSRERYRQIIQSSPSGISIFKPNGDHKFASRRSKEIFGYNVNLPVDIPISGYKYFLPENHDKLRKYFKKTIESREVQKAQFSVIKESGDQIIIEAYSSSRTLQNGEKEIILIFNDISHKVIIEKSLKEREATLNTIINSSPDSIYAIDINFNLLAFNVRASEDFLKYGGVNLEIGKSLKSFYPKSRFDDIKSTILTNVFNGHTENYESKVQTTDDIQYFNNKYAPLKDSEGNIIGCIEISRNVTKSRKDEILLVANEKKYKDIFENASQAILYFDLKTKKIIDCNQKTLEIFQAESKAQYINNNPNERFLERLDKKGATTFDETVVDLIKEGVKKGKYTYIVKSKTLKKRILIIEGNVIYNKESDPDRILFFLSDITEKWQFEKEKEDLYSLQNQLMNSIPSSFRLNDIGGRIINCNDTFAFQQGQSDRNQIIGKLIDEVFSEKDLIEIKREDAQIISSKKPLQTLAHGTLPDGESIILQIDKTPFFDQDGKVVGVLSHGTNVTKLIDYQNKIKERTTIYEALVNNSFEGIDIVELVGSGKITTGKLILRNQPMATLFGNSTDPIITLNDFVRVSHTEQPNIDNVPMFIKDLVKKLMINKVINHEWILINSKGKKVYVEAVARIVDIENKRLLIRIYRDISKRKKQESIIAKQIIKLNSKNNELEKYIESNLQLENFAYITSHDLKAPIRTVMSFSELLLKTSPSNLSKKEQGFLQIIFDSSKNMQILIDDLLAFSRVNTQKINIEEVNVERLINEVKFELGFKIETSKAKLMFGRLPKMINADKIKMKQLFQNLISNALKFNQSTPTIEITSTDTTEEFIFIIKDNGIGISPENHDKIFNIFERLHSKDIYEGTGLGLTICKKLVEQHEGRIWVESNINSGSSFYFSIPK